MTIISNKQELVSSLSFVVLECVESSNNGFSKILLVIVSISSCVGKKKRKDEDKEEHYRKNKENKECVDLPRKKRCLSQLFRPLSPHTHLPLPWISLFSSSS